MSKAWTVGVAALLSCLLARTAAAEQGAPAVTPKASEEKPVARKPAPESAVAGEAQKKQVGAMETSEKPLVDRYGKRVTIREQLIDSKGKEIPFTDVPLRETYMCYPPPGQRRADRESGANGLPKGYVCKPVYPEQHQVLRVLEMSCPYGYRPCVIPNYPSYVGCCPP